MTQPVLHHVNLVLHGVITTLHLSRQGGQPITHHGKTLRRSNLVVESGVDTGKASVDNLVPITIKSILVGQLLVQLEELTIDPSQLLRQLPQVAIGDVLVLFLLLDRLLKLFLEAITLIKQG